jgi:predicted nucleic acid-binding protein
MESPKNLTVKDAGTLGCSPLGGMQARLASAIRSNWLPMLQEISSQIPELAPFLSEYLQVRVVIDANVVHKELQWRLQSRRKADARTRLEEAAIAQVLILFAPTHLESEIQEHLAEIAARSGSTVEAAEAEWKQFRSCLHFYTPRSLKLGRSIAVVDPDDLPYIAACHELGAHAVYSRDKHFKQMKAPVISVAFDASLQSYSRATTVRLAAMVGSTFTITVGMKAIEAAGRKIGKAFQFFRQLHPLLQIALLAGLVLAFTNRNLRKKFAEFFRLLAKFARPVFEAVLLMAEQFQIESMKIQIAESEIRALLPRARKRSALTHARAICLLHRKPISCAEIETQMKAEGYVSSARDFPAYLTRILRESEQFSVDAHGRWSLI